MPCKKIIRKAVPGSTPNGLGTMGNSVTGTYKANSAGAAIPSLFSEGIASGKVTGIK